MEVKNYKLGSIKDEKLKFAVIFSIFNGKYLYVKHKKRDTFEIPGGHRELNEDINYTAERELREETGAVKFQIEPVCEYSVKRKDEDISYGRLYYANVEELGKLPDYEIGNIELFDDIPNILTYPEIQEVLHKWVLSYINKESYLIQ
ncbi:NUDIX hydrolase [Clostridium amazonitimonense]|uniref:NUDIX hydrolase n=1 Tax=Clostridium amazonitimonense TaxID=1499689 RepID=UPI000509DAD8|nr:NUDIX domain-containing protein [Clostridium amazonitimonense]